MADEGVTTPSPATAPGNAAVAPAATAAVTPAAPVAASAHASAPQEAKHKVKTRKPKQRACDEKDEKGKLCGGHLKRWYDYPKDVEALIGKKAEIYRCEFCKTLYKPDLSEMPHSYTNRF